MRKRISKQKDTKMAIKHNSPNLSKPMMLASPILTMIQLQARTDCLQKVRQFEKVRIDRIIRGNSMESICFQQIQKNCSFEEFMRQYYPFSDTTRLFTDLITKNSLVSDITFMDFKLKNFRIMNTYSSQLKQYRDSKCKSDTKVTASSSMKKGKHFKEMEYGIKRITKKRLKSIGKNPTNTSSSFINMLAKNIQKMIKNIKDSSVIQDKNKDDKPFVRSSKQLCLTDISKIEQERLHTSPETAAFDSYGLEGLKDKHSKKTFQSSHLIKNAKDKVKPQKGKDTHRFQTEYDTDYIRLNKSKSKKSNSKFTSKTKPNGLSRVKSTESIKPFFKAKK